MNFSKKIIFLLLLILILPSCNSNPKKIKINYTSIKLHKEDNYIKLKKNIKSLNYRKSLKLIKMLLLTYPKNAELYYLLAIITKNTNPDPLKAIKLLQVSVSLNDKYGKAWKLLGDLYYIRKEFKSALKAWEISIETIKDDANLYYRLGYLYYTLKEYKYAIKYFEKSLKIDNKTQWNYYYLGEIYFKNLANTKKGIEYIKKGLKILPKSKNLNQKLAIFYYDTGNYNKAIKWNKYVLKIVNYDNFAIENISDAYMQLKDYDKAINWLNKILKEQPKSIYYLKKLSDIFIIQKKFKKAIELLEFANNLKEDSDIKSKIAKLYRITGNTKKYKKILKELGSSNNPSDNRASVYLKMEENHTDNKSKKANNIPKNVKK